MATIGELKAGAVVSKEEFAVPTATTAGQPQGQRSVDLYVPKLSGEVSLPTTVVKGAAGKPSFLGWGRSILASPYVAVEGGASGAQTASRQVFAAEVTGRLGSDFIYQGMDPKYGAGFYGGGGGFVQGSYQSVRFEDATTGEKTTGSNLQAGAGLRGIAGYHTEDRGSGYWMFEGAAGLATQIGVPEQDRQFFTGARLGHSF